jgi:peptidoglycan hydrolase CwlO-like protein
MKKINKNKLKINLIVNKITSDGAGVVLFFLSFLLILFLFSTTNFVQADDEDEIMDKKEEYEEELDDLEEEAEKTETEIQQVNQQIYQTQGVIQKTAQSIEELEDEIENKKDSIEKKKKNIAFKKKILEEYIRLYRRNILELGLATFNLNRDLGQYLRDTEKFEDFQSRIKDALEIIKEEKSAIENEKEEIEGKKEEKDEALESQEQQKRNLVYQENQKKDILAQTHLSIAEVKSKINSLNSRLNAFLDEDFNLGDLIDAVEEAEDETGVRKEFIFAMLDKESDLGRFTGGCEYNKVKSHMKDADRDVFKDLMDELGYDKDDVKLSCWPGYGYGGAMGIAQFMPTTWIGYKDEISKKTGNKPPNPWRLEDGVMGMAIKLARAGAASKSKEHYAAKLYYCGGPSSSYWDNKCEAYADTVKSWSEGYDDYFD